MVLGVVLMTVPRPRNIWMSHASNAAHVLLSALVAGVVLRSRRRLRGAASPRPADYLAAMVAVALLGGGLELAQMVGPGAPSSKDLGLDLMGGLAALLMAAAYQRRGWGLGLSGVVIMLLALSTPLRVVSDAARLWFRWPVLVDFDSAPESRFWGTDDGARVSLARAPSGFTLPTQVAARVSFGFGRYPAFFVRPLRTDWSQHEVLVFDVYSAYEAPQVLHLRVHDCEHNQRYEDRFNAELRIQPGAQTVRMMLQEIASGPRDRRLNLKAVTAVILFMDGPEPPVDLHFGSFRLE